MSITRQTRGKTEKQKEKHGVEKRKRDAKRQFHIRKCFGSFVEKGN